MPTTALTTTANLKAHDPFMYYSNQNRRMTHLLLNENITDQVDAVVAPDLEGQATMVVQRKTRISFELHPSLLLDDLIVETMGADGNAE